MKGLTNFKLANFTKKNGDFQANYLPHDLAAVAARDSRQAIHGALTA
jgi:hypothetical protein